MAIVQKLQNLPSMFLDQGDAEYLRYHGLQEFDRAMQHLEERFGVSLHIFPASVPLLFSMSRNYLKPLLEGHITVI